MWLRTHAGGGMRSQPSHSPEFVQYKSSFQIHLASLCISTKSNQWEENLFREEAILGRVYTGTMLFSHHKRPASVQKLHATFAPRFANLTLKLISKYYNSPQCISYNLWPKIMIGLLSMFKKRNAIKHKNWKINWSWCSSQFYSVSGLVCASHGEIRSLSWK